MENILKWSLINNTAGYLNTALDKRKVRILRKNIIQNQRQEEDWKRAVSAVNGGLGEIVGKVYVKKHFTPEAKERMTAMVKNLLKAYAASIKVD